MIVLRHLLQWPRWCCADRHTYTESRIILEVRMILNLKQCILSETAASRQPEFQSMSAEVDETQWQWSCQELGT
jgi:hypothetical protein